MKLQRFSVNVIPKLIGGLLTVTSMLTFFPEPFAAFSSPSSEASHRQKDILRLGWYTKPAPLDPFSITDTISVPLRELIFNRLVRFDQKGDFQPDLAERWEISQDGLVYTFYLKKNVYFHDKVLLTARDLELSFRLASDKAISPLLYKNFEVVKEWRVVSENVFQVILKEPFAPFLLSLWRAYIIPKHLFLSKNPSGDLAVFIQHPVGTGPFQFESQDPSTGEINLRANPGYFEGRPAFEGVNVLIFPDKDRVWSAFLRDEIDILLYLGPSNYREIKDNPSFHTYQALSMGIHALVFNLNNSELKDLRIRQAIAHAVNQKEIIEQTAAGAGFLISGPFHPKSWAANPEVPESIFDPEKARKLFLEAGFSDTQGTLEKKGIPFVLDLLVDPKDSFMMNVAKVLRQQLQEIGVRTQFHFFNGYPDLTKKLYEDPEGFQCFLLGMNSGPEPDLVRRYWYSTAAINISHYRNPKVDSLFDAAARHHDRESRQQAYRQIHAQLAKDHPAVFLYVPYIFHALSGRFKNAPFLYSSFFQMYMLKDLSFAEKTVTTTKGGDADDGDY